MLHSKLVFVFHWDAKFNLSEKLKDVDLNINFVQMFSCYGSTISKNADPLKK